MKELLSGMSWESARKVATPTHMETDRGKQETQGKNKRAKKDATDQLCTIPEALNSLIYV